MRKVSIAFVAVAALAAVCAANAQTLNLSLLPFYPGSGFDQNTTVTTHSNLTIDGISSTTGWAAGDVITCPNLPAGDAIASVTNSTSAVITIAASTSATVVCNVTSLDKTSFAEGAGAGQNVALSAANPAQDWMSGIDAGQYVSGQPPSIATTGSFSAGNATITVAASLDMVAGDSVTASAGLPPGAMIASVVDGTHITVDTAHLPTLNETSVTVTDIPIVLGRNYAGGYSALRSSPTDMLYGQNNTACGGFTAGAIEGSSFGNTLCGGGAGLHMGVAPVVGTADTTVTGGAGVFVISFGAGSVTAGGPQSLTSIGQGIGWYAIDNTNRGALSKNGYVVSYTTSGGHDLVTYSNYGTATGAITAGDTITFRYGAQDNSFSGFQAGGGLPSNPIEITDSVGMGTKACQQAWTSQGLWCFGFHAMENTLGLWGNDDGCDGRECLLWLHGGATEDWGIGYDSGDGEGTGSYNGFLDPLSGRYRPASRRRQPSSAATPRSQSRRRPILSSAIFRLRRAFRAVHRLRPSRTARISTSTPRTFRR